MLTKVVFWEQLLMPSIVGWLCSLGVGIAQKQNKFGDCLVHDTHPGDYQRCAPVMTAGSAGRAQLQSDISCAGSIASSSEDTSWKLFALRGHSFTFKRYIDLKCLFYWNKVRIVQTQMRFCDTFCIKLYWFYPVFLPFGPQYFLLYICFISFKIEVLFHYNIVNEEKHSLYRKGSILWWFGPHCRGFCCS